MTLLEALSQITPLLYASILLLPLFLWGYFKFSKSKKIVSIDQAIPGDQLKEKTVDAGREFLVSFFLGGTLALGAAIIIFLGQIISDYKNSEGIFASVVPNETYPPGPSFTFPPKPVIAATDKNNVENADNANIDN